MSDHNIDNLFKEAFSDYKKKPSRRVWLGVLAGLPAAKPLQLVHKFLIGLAAVVLVGVLGYTGMNLLDQKEQPVTVNDTVVTNNNSTQQNSGSGNTPANTGETTHTGEAQPEPPPAEPLERINTPIVNKNNTTPPLPDTEPVNFEAIEEEAILEELQQEASPERIPLYINTALSGGEFGEIGIRKLARLSIDTKTKENIRNKFFNINGIHFGPLYRYNSTFIINQNTYGEFEWNSELNYQMTYGNSYGVNFGYDFSTNFGIQVEWIFHSQKGQNYSDRINKKHIRREVDFSYTEVPVLIKYKLSRMTKKNPNVTNLVVGVQYEYLKNATIKIYEKGVNVSRFYEQTGNPLERFNRDQVGLVFGWEQDFYCSRNVFFTLGGRGAFSLFDINHRNYSINKFKVVENENFGQSHNFTFGLTASINYIIK